MPMATPMPMPIPTFADASVPLELTFVKQSRSFEIGVVSLDKWLLSLKIHALCRRRRLPAWRQSTWPGRQARLPAHNAAGAGFAHRSGMRQARRRGAHRGKEVVQ